MSSIEKNKRILVVEEETGLRMVIESELVRAGYDVTAVSTSLDSLTRLAKDKYDLALIDVALPEKTGMELLRTIRNKYSSMHIVMLAGMDVIPAAVKAIRLGATDYIPKPFDAEYLLISVRTVLKQRR